MTEAQLQSISAMKLTQEDVMELVRQQVPAMSSGSTTGDGPVFGNGGPPSGGPPGGFPGGDVPAGCLRAALEEDCPAELRAMVRRQPTPSGPAAGVRGGIPVPLVNAVIEYLKEKAAS